MGHSATDRFEFEGWFRALYPAAIGVALRILGDPAAAEDATAEAFARAYLRWSRVRSMPHRDAWLLRVVSNVSIDGLRRRRVLPEALDTVEPDDELVALRVTLGVALTKLPRRQREAVVLRYLGGLSNAEVATSMRFSAESVKEHLSRGLARLRQQLGSNWKEFDLACD